METVLCQCGRTIRVLGGIQGLALMHIPYYVYFCPCGYAYRPQIIGCLLVHSKVLQEGLTKPIAMSPSEYEAWKKERIEDWKQSGRPVEDAVTEISAEVVEQNEKEVGMTEEELTLEEINVLLEDLNFELSTSGSNVIVKTRATFYQTTADLYSGEARKTRLRESAARKLEAMAKRLEDGQDGKEPSE